MHSTLSRLNSIFFFALMCLAACGGFAALSHWIPQINPPDDQKSLIFNVTKVHVESLLSNPFIQNQNHRSCIIDDVYLSPN